ncbi:MAG: hypothetical protein AAFX87_28550 [Bacteroidota bacterium]
MEEVYEELVLLFDETGGAHHEAFADTDGYDPEWPLWYSEYMLEQLRSILEADFTRSELIYLLISAHNEQTSDAPGSRWKDYFATYFLERYI